MIIYVNTSSSEIFCGFNAPKKHNLIHFFFLHFAHKQRFALADRRLGGRERGQAIFKPRTPIRVLDLNISFGHMKAYW